MIAVKGGGLFPPVLAGWRWVPTRPRPRIERKIAAFMVGRRRGRGTTAAPRPGCERPRRHCSRGGGRPRSLPLGFDDCWVRLHSAASSSARLTCQHDSRHAAGIPRPSQTIPVLADLAALRASKRGSLHVDVGGSQTGSKIPPREENPHPHKCDERFGSAFPSINEWLEKKIGETKPSNCISAAPPIRASEIETPENEEVEPESGGAEGSDRRRTGERDGSRRPPASKPPPRPSAARKP